MPTAEAWLIYGQVVLEAISAAGFVVFFFISIFSDYLRPFMAGAWNNAKAWTHGNYSIRTGRLRDPVTLEWRSTSTYELPKMD